MNRAIFFWGLFPLVPGVACSEPRAGPPVRDQTWEERAPAAALPRLQVDAGGRFLVTAEGQPFFWLGDTAWFLLRLTQEETRYYLENRVHKGFTGLQVDLNLYAWREFVPEGESENPFLYGC